MDRNQSDSIQGTGLFVVVLGPDGSGKSTVVDRIVADTRNSFSDVWCFHWRPGLLPQPGRRSEREALDSSPPLPPTKFAYGRTISFIRYVYFLTDFIFGYWACIYLRRKRGELVIGERWYFDVLINPQRYGFKLPAWLLRCGGYLIPKPDLTVLLKADPDAIFERKPELTVQQITTQISAMRSILPEYPKGSEISTDIPLNDSVAELLTLLKEARDRRCGIVDGWRMFPRFTSPKVFIANSDQVGAALQLYNPYSVVGKIAKKVAIVLPRIIISSSLSSSAWYREIAFISRQIHKTLKDDKLDISFATGTPGPHRKMTAQVRKDGNTIAYVKVAKSVAAIELVKCEASSLNEIDLVRNQRLAVPRVISEEKTGAFNMLFLSAPETASFPRPLEFDELDVSFIESMLPISPESVTLNTIWSEIVTDGNCSNDAVDATRVVLETLMGSSGIRVGPAHGDYTPWNTLCLDDGRLFVFDWEYYCSAVPLFSDLFQRVFMHGWLVSKLPAASMASELCALRLDKRVQPLIQKLNVGESEFVSCLLLYLLRQGFRNADEQGLPPYVKSCLQHVITQTKYLCNG